MKNFTLLFSFTSLISLFVISPTFGQRCLTDQLRHARFANNPALAEQAAEIEISTQKWITEHGDINQRDGNAEVTLPVVVHILWRLNEDNISDEQMQSQIAVLNDYENYFFARNARCLWYSCFLGLQSFPEKNTVGEGGEVLASYAYGGCFGKCGGQN